MLLTALLFSACQKDAIKIDTEKSFYQERTTPIKDPMLDGGFSLTLKPNGKAAINPGGDIVWSATYDISGKTITVKVFELDEKFKFTIISDEELRGPNGEVMKLSHN